MSLILRLFVPISAIFASLSAHAADGDLVLPDAFHLAKFDRLICQGFDEAGVAEPSSLSSRQVHFEALQGDRMLIQFLVTATFIEGGRLCRYSALTNRAPRNTLRLSQSKAFTPDGSVDCAQGKAELDAMMASTPYSYTKDPIRFLALKMPMAGAADVCGEGATAVRVVFDRGRH